MRNRKEIYAFGIFLKDYCNSLRVRFKKKCEFSYFDASINFKLILASTKTQT